MQRMPTRRLPAGGQTVNAMESETSPLLELARRIRREQGVEQLRAFLRAMLPFSAPNELRYVSEAFGISFESISAHMERIQVPAAEHTDAGRARNGQNQLDMLKMLLQVTSMMKGGGDMMKLLNMMKQS